MSYEILLKKKKRKSNYVFISSSLVKLAVKLVSQGRICTRLLVGKQFV